MVDEEPLSGWATSKFIVAIIIIIDFFYPCPGFILHIPKVQEQILYLF